MCTVLRLTFTLSNAKYVDVVQCNGNGRRGCLDLDVVVPSWNLSKDEDIANQAYRKRCFTSSSKIIV